MSDFKFTRKPLEYFPLDVKEIEKCRVSFDALHEATERKMLRKCSMLTDLEMAELLSHKLCAYPKSDIDDMLAIGQKIHIDTEEAISNRALTNVGVIGKVYLPMTSVAMAVRSILGIKNAAIPFS